MNRKIFTLLVGAILLIGSVVTVNAQLPYPQLPKLPYSQKAAPGLSVNFFDRLTADAVEKLPSNYQEFYYLLGVTGIANPSSTGPTAFDGLFNCFQYAEFQYECAVDLVLTVDDWDLLSNPPVRRLRLEDLAVLDYSYKYKYPTPPAAGGVHTKFSALRRALWCMKYFLDGVGGSNIIYDFTNMETGLLLQAPLYSDNPAWWSPSTGPNRVFKGNPASLNKGPLNIFDSQMIVNGWHFSQTYLSSQKLQQNMPMYSYVSKDTVAVFVLDKDNAARGPFVEEKTGGWAITVKHVAVNDLIADAMGNVYTGTPAIPGKTPIENVLLFTLKKANPFVMNANDWNAGAKGLSFNKNATIEVTNQDKTTIKYKNPFTDGGATKPLKAFEVNDSLYHYGYMQFQAQHDAALNKFLFVDTAWVNYGNNEYLAFGWDKRRDDILAWSSHAEASTAIKWCGTFVPKYTLVSAGTKNSPDYLAYMNAGGTFYWRLDSIIWSWVERVAVKAGLTVNNYIYDNSLIWNGNGAHSGLIDFTQKDLDDWNVIMMEAETIALLNGISTFTPILADAIAAGYTNWNLFPEAGSTFLGFPFNGHKFALPILGGTHHVEVNLYDDPNVKMFYKVGGDKKYTGVFEKLLAEYKADVYKFQLTYFRDSIMENQSKFRVVYDPTHDSTFINVYQSRVRYMDYSNGSHNAKVEPWWTNSFGIKTVKEVVAGPGLGGDYTGIIRPSDFWTGLAFDGTQVGPYLFPIAEAAINYYNEIRPPIVNESQLPVEVIPGFANVKILVEGHGEGYADGTRESKVNTLVLGHPVPSIFNFHSFMEFYPQSNVPYMDRVLISTADTVTLFYKADIPAYLTWGDGVNFRGLSHMYGWSVTNNETLKYRDSLLYVDIQNLESEAKIITTLNQSYKNGEKRLNSHIRIKYGDRCEPEKDVPMARIDNDLYLIRNTLGQYLCVPLYSHMDSIYWVTPEPWEDPTKIPSYQWAIMNIRESGGSPFRMVNREFEKVDIQYAYLNEGGPSKFIISGKFAGSKFNDRLVVGAHTPIGRPLQQGEVDPKEFALNVAKIFPISQYSFIRLDKVTKEDQTIGYRYLDKDSTYIDVYAFKMLHAYSLGDNKPKYLSWHGYDLKKVPRDTVLYSAGTDSYDKLYFHLQEMTKDNMEKAATGASAKSPQGWIELTKENTASGKDYFDFLPLYNTLSSRQYRYFNGQSILLERFGFYEANTKITYLKPIARQAYRMFLQDYYRWHPTIKGHYVTVGAQDRYVLADRANVRPYNQTSRSVVGLFGMPHFYFRNTFFDVEKRNVKDDYFAIVQRWDTLRYSKEQFSADDYQYMNPYGLPSRNDIYEYLVRVHGSTAAKKIFTQIDQGELGLALLDVEHDYLRAKFTMRGDLALSTNVSAFQLERDADPIYRRIHVNEPDGKFYPEMKDNPDILEFHLVQGGTEGQKLFENTGNYMEDDYLYSHLSRDPFTPYGRDGGRVHNRKNDGFGDYFRDTLKNVISFLGSSNSVSYPKTNRAIYVDTAYINRGTGWIKPQYLLVVDPYNPLEKGECVPWVGDIVSPNEQYVIGRYLYNTTQYAKAVKDSVLNTKDFVWDYTDKLTPEITLNGEKKRGYMFSSNNFNKVQPVKYDVFRKPNGSEYTLNGDKGNKMERLAFSWAIHKGDKLYVLKGLEPAYQGDAPFDEAYIGDPQRVFAQLVRDYGGGSGMAKFINFDKLVNDNVLSSFNEVYFENGDLSALTSGKWRTYYTFKSMADVKASGKKIGLQAIIDLNDNTHKDWVFSFRYVERGSSDFVIESETSERDIRNAAIIRPGFGGWVKIFNPEVPVITRTDEKDNMGQAGGSVMNVKRLTNPVGNEVGPNAAVGVSVIGGTGSVSILNAAGKKVVVSNMLGQTIANTTLNSDNAAIAAPAGVIAVAVEGESAAKVLVK